MTASRLLSLRGLLIPGVLCLLLLLSGCTGRLTKVSVPQVDIPPYLRAYYRYEQIRQIQPEEIEIKAEFIEKSKNDSGQNVARYKIVGNGLPMNTQMTFSSLYGGYSDLVNFEVYTDSTGVLYKHSKDTTGLQEPVIITCDALSASCSYYFLESVDPKYPFVASLRIIPVPVTVEGKDRGHIELTRLEKGANFILLKLSGLEPKEFVRFISRSCDETISERYQADEKGDINIISLPPVINRNEGENMLRFYYGGNKLSINLYWTQKDWTKKDRKMFQDGAVHRCLSGIKSGIY